MLAAMLSLSTTGRAVELSSVGVSVSDFGNPFFVQIAKGVVQKVAAIGTPDATVSVVSNNYDLATQIQQINDFIVEGVQMIVLNAADSEGVLPVLEKAKQAGIVVIAVDIEAQGADATIMSDNFQAGRMACEYMAERLQGEGDVIIINGPFVSSTIDRVAGCKASLTQYPAIRLLSDEKNGGGSQDGGLAVMTALLFAFPKIDAVFAVNDPTALGADLAARQAGRDEFFIVSVDGAPSAEEALQDGVSLLMATAAQDPRVMAMRGVDIGYGLLNGSKPEQNPTLLPTPLITRENVYDYKGWTTE